MQLGSASFPFARCGNLIAAATVLFILALAVKNAGDEGRSFYAVPGEGGRL